MSAHVRSQGRLTVTEEDGENLKAMYDPLSKTAILLNVDHYGWIESIALSGASDILEGQGTCLIAPPGTGKTTHTYGLPRLKGARVISDDWFFVCFLAEESVAFSSEKDLYVQADIAETLGEYRELVDKAEFDAKGRAVVNVRWVVGKGKILPLTTLRTAILLRRDRIDETIVKN